MVLHNDPLDGSRPDGADPAEQAPTMTAPNANMLISFCSLTPSLG